jgi:hypothetical protein
MFPVAWQRASSSASPGWPKLDLNVEGARLEQRELLKTVNEFVGYIRANPDWDHEPR